MVRAVRPLRSLSTARGCARIDSRLDTAKIGSAGRVEVRHARLLAVIGVRKTFPHGLDPELTLAPGKIVEFALPERDPFYVHPGNDLLLFWNTQRMILQAWLVT